MKKMIMGVLALGVLAFAGGYYVALDAKAPMEKVVAVPVKNEVVLVAEPDTQVIPPLAIDIAKAMEDRPKGDANAPFTVIEYASLTCPHCAAFNNKALPVVQKELIDTGKMRMIFRDFPLDKFAVKASMLTRCAPPEKYHDILDTIFKEQQDWVKTPDPLKALTDIGVRFGMDAGQIASCFATTQLQDALLASMKEAQANFQVSRTPSFFFKQGEEMMTEYPAFQKIVESNSEDPHDHH